MPPELGARHLSPGERYRRGPSLESSQGHWAETGDRSGSWGRQGDMSGVGVCDTGGSGCVCNRKRKAYREELLGEEAAAQGGSLTSASLC